MANTIKVARHGSISAGSLAIDVIIYLVAGIAGIITVWPFIYVFSMSLSEPTEVLKQSVWLYPKGLNLQSYELLFQNSFLWRSYANTIFYVVTGTFLNGLMSVIGAYPLTKKGFYGRKLIIVYIIIPMYFGGGLIPYFLLLNKLGLYNNILVMIIPGMVTIWNIILVRTFFTTLPDSLNEAATIDGAGETQILFRIMLPLSKPILAVISLYTAVGIWNSWFNAMVFLPNPKLQPLQLFLAKVLVFESPDIKVGGADMLQRTKVMATSQQIKYATIIFSSLPIICTYPFLQKYFIKGALLGSLKE